MATLARESSAANDPLMIAGETIHPRGIRPACATSGSPMASTLEATP